MSASVAVIHPVLAPAEVRALQLAADGESCGSSARLLGLALATLKNQRHSACLKLGADNTCHAVAQAIRRGLIQ